MTTLLKRLWNDERGFIVSAEIVLIVTIGVLGIIVGISSVASSINNELNDISGAFGAVDQSYWYSGMVKFGHSGVAGSAFADTRDYCDCTTIVRTVPGAKLQARGPLPAPPPIAPPAPPRVAPPPRPACPTGCPPAAAPCPHGRPCAPAIGATGHLAAPEHCPDPLPCPPAYRRIPCPVPALPHHPPHAGRPRLGPHEPPHGRFGPRLKPRPEPKFRRRRGN